MAILIVVFLIIIFILILFVRAWCLKPIPVSEPLPPSQTTGDARSVERFQEILQSATVWDAGNPDADHTSFDEFVPKLKQLYPTVFANLELTMVNTYGIMLKWTGANPELAPIVLMAHHDVVEANPTGWTHDPFAAKIVDGKIWARGAVDTKCILAALLEATDHLLSQGHTPPRDIYLCSSNCEEDRGETVPQMVTIFKNRGIVPYLVLDEGGAVIDNAPLGISREFAVIGISEKGVLDALITTNSLGGHAATPSPEDATSKLVSGLDALQKNPPTARLPLPVETMLKELASYGNFMLRLVFGNLWLFKPLVMRIMKSNHETAAMLRTTYAITQLEGSQAANVIPRQAKATVNVRVDPSESVTIAMDRLKAYFDDKTDFRIANDVNPSPFAPFDDEAFNYLRKIIHSVYPDAGIAPYIQSSCSDARHFHQICPHTYRFAGFLFTGNQRASIHGQDENLDVESYLRGVGFYTELIRHLDIVEK